MDATATKKVRSAKPAKLSNVEDIYPMSPMQQGILFHSLYEPGLGMYFLGLACRIQAALDVQAFRRAWEEVIRRHTALRTGFLWGGLNQPRQVVRKSVDLPWQEEDWRGWSESEQKEKWKNFLAENRKQGFDFKRAPLLRLALMRTGEQSYYFSWASHHIVLDGWARQVVMQEAFALYEAYRQGRAPQLKRPRLYRDYIAWLQKQQEAKAEAFWREQLEGFTTPTRLGIELESSSGEEGGSEYGLVKTRLSAEQGGKVEELAREQMVTLSTVVQAGWAVVLGRYSGEEDVVFGATVSGRSGANSEFEETVGLFINTLPVRVKLRSGEKVGEYVQRLQQRNARSLDYEYSPLLKVQEWSGVARGTPLFNNIVVFENYPVDEAIQRGAGSTLNFSGLSTFESTSFPLGLVVRPGTELALLCHHDCRWYDRQSVERLLRHLSVALENIAKNPEARVEELSLLTEAERSQLLATWRSPALACPPQQGIGSLVAYHARQHPQARALVAEGRELSYVQLSREANQWAHFLMRQGVQAGERVGVCLEQAADVLVVALGVLKRGAVVVGLEAEEPDQRLQRMVESSRVGVVIAEKAVGEKLAGSKVRLLYVEEVGAEVRKEREEEPELEAEISGESVACVLYRSSGNGPLGILLPQRALLAGAFVEGRREQELRMGEPERVAQRVGFGREAESLEMFRVLAGGGCVVNVSARALLAPRKLADLLRSQKVTVLWSSAAMLERMAREFPWALKNVWQILCEERPAILVQLRETLEAEVLARVYGVCGCSEAGGRWMTYPLSSMSRPGVMPAHHLAAGVSMYLLDSQKQPVAEGMLGEIYLSGECVALGYEQEEPQSASVLMPDLYSGRPKAQMYRTGDFARWHSDGTLEFHDWQDGRALIAGLRRGFEEIEAALLKHQEVREAAVMMRGPSGDAAAGLMMVIEAAQGTVSGEELRHFLQARLPEFMIPKNFIQVESIPRCLEGGVDRRALLRMLEQHELAKSVAEYVAPRNQIEELLAGIWAQTLGLERVGVHDNFLQLGGHSLLATQLVARINDVLHVELPLRRIFESPTVAELARVTEKLMAAGEAETSPPIVRVPREQAMPISFAQQRLWFLDQLAPGSPAYNLHIGIRLSGVLNREALNWSLQEIVKRHESLRTSFVTRAGNAVQVIAAEVKLAVEEIEVPGGEAEERERETARLARKEAATPFDLSRVPLLRVKLLRLAEQQNVLLVTMHHIVSDGLSMGVLVREFSRLYTDCVLGKKSSLPELEIQYADFTVWQRAWLQGEVLERQVGYWRKQLADVRSLKLPTDRPRPEVMSQRGATIRVNVDLDLMDQLNKLSRREGVTLFMSLLAAWQLLLSRYTGQHDIPIGTPIAGRTRTETGSIIGFFVNTLVLRTQINGHASFRELLQAVRQRTLEAYEHQDVPFEKVVDELQPDRDLGRQPFFQVAFGLQNAQEPFHLPGLEMVALQPEGEGAPAKFDLMLLLEETGKGLQGILEYTPDLFDRATLETMIQRWKMVLEQVVKDAAKPVARISLTSDAEHELLASGWQGHAVACLEQQNIGSLVAHHARQRPQASALVAEERELSYAQLNREANQWAHFLMRQGVQAGERVGVCLEQAADALVVTLGVLKRGAVAVGLEAEEPGQRLQSMVENSRPGVVIAGKAAGEKLAGSRVRVLYVEEVGVEVRKEKEEEPELEVEISGESVACVLYRSSSRGPLGILLPQRALWAGAVAEEGEEEEKKLRVGESERVAQRMGFGWEAESLEMFRVLAGGGCVVNVSARTLLAPRKLADLLRSQKVTVLWIPAAMLEQVAREFPWALKSVRQILCEERPTILGQLRETLKAEVLARVYGVCGYSEAGGRWMTYPLASLAGQRISGLKPEYFAPGTKMWLLDSYLEPVPDGVLGEIYVGGELLAASYQDEARLTAGAWVPDAFSGVRGGRLYRTGDWAWRRADGSLEYRERQDGRGLLDGLRVDAEEIETILAEQPGVQEAAVVMREVPGQRQSSLVALLVEAEGQKIVEEELLGLLRRKLREEVVPKSLMVVEKIARMAGGGVDREAALRMVEAREAASAAPEYEGPRTEVEKILSEVWKEVLNVERVGVHDNFFKLGGDSILSIQVIARARQAGVGLAPRQIFEKQTIAELAVVAGKVNVEVVAEQGVVSGTVPLTPFQRVFFEWKLAKPEYFNQSVMLGLDREAETGLLEEAVKGLLEQHDALRMRYERSAEGAGGAERIKGAGGWRQIGEAEAPGGVYERVNLAGMEEREQRKALERDMNRVQSSLDPVAGRLVKAVEYELGEERGRRLLLVIHHLVVDGVSWRILVEDLERGYEQRRSGKELRLGTKTTSFKQWAERLQEYGGEERVRKEVTYWTSERRKKVKPLPLDHNQSHAKNLFATQKNVTVQLSEEETRALLQDVPGVYNTQINDVLLTALARVLGEWSGSESVLVELEGHGREEIFEDVDLSRTVGWFTSTYPALLEMGKGQKWEPGKALSRVKEQLRAVPNRGLGYGVLRHLANDDQIRRRLEEIPPAEIIFNYLGQIDQVLRQSALLVPAQEGSGIPVAAENRRPFLLDVNAMVVQDRLHMSWNYSEELHRPETIERIANQFAGCLRELIIHCRSEEAGGFTPSDFPVAGMSQQEFMLVASLLDK